MWRIFTVGLSFFDTLRFLLLDLSKDLSYSVFIRFLVKK